MVRAERLTRVEAAVTVGVSAILGLAAALLDGPLTSLGSGPGGLYGVPGIVLAALVVVGLVAAVGARADPPRALVSFVGPVLVVAAFVPVAHALDPCVTGVWDGASRFDGAPLCEPYEGGLNIETRFHLLMHALPALPVVLVYWFAPGWLSGRRLRSITGSRDARSRR